MNCLDNIKLYTVIIQKNSKLKQKLKMFAYCKRNYNIWISEVIM